MKFGSSKPVSGQELEQARACLKLLKKKISTDPPTYFQTSAPEVPSSYRKVFKPESKNILPPSSSNMLAAPVSNPIRPPLKKPNNVAIDSSKGFSQYDFEGVEGANPSSHDDRIECPDCGRKFQPESYDKHVNICKKVFINKRKQFNSADQRVDDDAAPISKKKPDPKKPSKTGASGGAKNKWQMQSEQFRANMRAARMAGTGDEVGYQEAAKIASDYEKSQLTKCQFCERSFNDEAAKRHIPICEKKARLNQMKSLPTKNAPKRK